VVPGTFRKPWKTGHTAPGSPHTPLPGGSSPLALPSPPHTLWSLLCPLQADLCERCIHGLPCLPTRESKGGEQREGAAGGWNRCLPVPCCQGLAPNFLPWPNGPVPLQVPALSSSKAGTLDLKVRKAPTYNFTSPSEDPGRTVPPVCHPSPLRVGSRG
jgi:hypothetical protein